MLPATASGVGWRMFTYDVLDCRLAADPTGPAGAPLSPAGLPIAPAPDTDDEMLELLDWDENVPGLRLAEGRRAASGLSESC
jgi:hypothetical protein